MKKLALFVLSLLLFIACNQDESYIVNDLNGNVNSGGGTTRPSVCNLTAPIYSDVTDKTELLSKVQGCFTPITKLSYSEARVQLYKNVDVVDGKLQTIYTGTETLLDKGASQSYVDAAEEKDINCEHAFPQSQGARLAGRADMYHIYPALDYVNSARSAYQFKNIESNSGAKWYKGREKVTSEPVNAGEWSKGITGAFEPRDSKKGDIARSVFYFYAIYNNVADKKYFEDMKDTLLEWHLADPVDSAEQTRADKVKDLQGNENPFILDADLAERLFF